MRKLILVGLVAAISGCANLQTVNDQLGKINGTLAGSSASPVGQLGDGTGYQPTFNIQTPAGVCNHQAFVDGFKDAYLQNWNQYVSGKVAQFNAVVTGDPANSQARNNLALYRSKMIGTKGYTGHQMNYQMQLGANSNCPYQSYQRGQDAGMNAVLSNWKVLISEEK